MITKSWRRSKPECRCKAAKLKSVRAGQINIKEGYVLIEYNQAWLINVHISPYDPASRMNHDPLRKKRLLLHKKEIRKLQESQQLKGLAIVPLRVYLKGGLAKIELGVGKRVEALRQAPENRQAGCGTRNAKNVETAELGGGILFCTGMKGIDGGRCFQIAGREAPISKNQRKTKVPTTLTPLFLLRPNPQYRA